MSRPVRRRRSVLYVPASNAKAVAKAAGLACDSVIFDLEDAVAPEAKVEARSNLLTYFRDAAFPARQERVIRVNGLDGTPQAEDMSVVAQCRPDAVLLPKV